MEKQDITKFNFEHDRISDGLDIYFGVFPNIHRYTHEDLHWHNALEISYIIEGSLDVTIGQQTYQLLPGDVFLIDSKVPHSNQSLYGNKGILIQLPYALLKKYIPNISNLQFSFDYRSEEPVLKTKITKLIETILQMQIVFEVAPDGGNLRFHSLLFELLFQLYHNFAHPANHNLYMKKHELIDKIFEYTNAHYNEPITLEHIATVACFQKEYFCHFFKKHTGITYTQYLNEIRLSHVINDLTTTDLPLKSILTTHAFTNYTLFRRMFNEKYHMTPSEYRKKKGQF